MSRLFSILNSPLFIHDLHSSAHISVFKMCSGVRANIPIFINSRPQYDSFIKNVFYLILVHYLLISILIISIIIIMRLVGKNGIKQFNEMYHNR